AMTSAYHTEYHGFAESPVVCSRWLRRSIPVGWNRTADYLMTSLQSDALPTALPPAGWSCSLGVRSRVVGFRDNQCIGSIPAFLRFFLTWGNAVQVRTDRQWTQLGSSPGSWGLVFRIKSPVLDVTSQNHLV